VLRIGTTYNALGDVYQVTTYNAASGGSIVNQAENIDNGLGQLIRQYQSHSGAVVPGTTPSVQYAYNELAGGANNSRLVSMTYPNGRVLDYNYNSGLDSSISRPSSISDSSATLESFVYLGLDTVVERDHPQTHVNMTYISQSGGTGDAGDQYTGLDRFGRVVEVNWVNSSTQTSTDDFQYGYDENGNVLYKDNMLDPSMSELYHASGAGNGYDGLNQLTAFARGTLSASQQGGQLDTVSNPSETESWTLDALGNFPTVTLNGAPTSETINQQNEVTADGSASLTYDKNGNTLTDNNGNSFKYNAWNQIVSASHSGTTIAAYSVDGLGRRATENEGGTLADVYFSAQWQVVEEDVANSMTNQYVWSPVYVNAMIERDTPTQRLYVLQDANWNVTALVNASGSVLERYVFDPYGAVTYLTASWGSQSGSNYGWHYLFQGGRLDVASGLYDFEKRDYSPTLARWTTDDPLGSASGDNDLYRFDSDSPEANLDAQGTQVQKRKAPIWAKIEGMWIRAWLGRGASGWYGLPVSLKNWRSYDLQLAMAYQVGNDTSAPITVEIWFVSQQAWRGGRQDNRRWQRQVTIPANTTTPVSYFYTEFFAMKRGGHNVDGWVNWLVPGPFPGRLGLDHAHNAWWA